jgi:glycosyltransferase involved in cell wall biosynthesis
MSEELLVSALLPVHAGLDPAHLRRCLDSVADQTRPPDELIVVEDGPLADEHARVIAEAEAGPLTLVRVALEQNGGAGLANGAGLTQARGRWIAKIDADDICLPERIERQLAFVDATGVDACSTWLEEFDADEGHVTAIRKVPTTHEAIARGMRMNNPLNHPSSFYRRDVALRAGGYPELRFMQDYDMFARMLVGGARFANMELPLVRFRADATMFRRRTSQAMNHCEWELQHNLRRYGLVNTPRMWFNLMARFTVRRLPPALLRAAYRRLFHGHPPEGATA